MGKAVGATRIRPEGNGSMGRRHPLATTVIVASVALSILAPGPGRVTGTAVASAAGTSAAVGSRPNIVLILTDDQRFDELRHMPNVRSALMQRGMTLTRSFVVNSLCCPSRAAILTGTYSHTNGLYLNGDKGAGGFPDFEDASTLPVWLRGAGYRTALIGKYFNHYEQGSYVPPGWTDWRGLVGSNSAYYDYDVSIDGSVVHYGAAPDDYATDVYAGMADQIIRSTASTRPLFLYFSPPAPHGPTTPAPRHETVELGSRLPSYPSFNERGVDDKPRWVAEMPRLGSDEVERLRRAWVKRSRSLLAVDDAVGRIVDALADTGRLGNTLLVFASDNGHSSGEHRLRYKLNAYEDSIRVPTVVRWDGQVAAGSRSEHLVANIDLAPTFAAVAGVSTPSWVEGRSLLPLLRQGRSVRGSLLIEHQHAGFAEDPPTYCAIRTNRWKLVRYERASELYDLANDPWELRNLSGRRDVADVLARLTARLRTLCDPRPPGMTAF